MPKRRVFITPVRQYGNRWGFSDYFSTGRRIQIRRKTKAAAEQAHTELSVLVTNGRKDLLGISAVELAEFRKFKEMHGKSRTLKVALAEFLALKEGTSRANYTALKYALQPLADAFGADAVVAAITTPQLQRLLDSRPVALRRKHNLLNAWKALWAYEQRQGYITAGRTAPERVERVPRVPGKVNVLTPDQLRVLFDNVREPYLPWLAIGAFAGVRSEEIAPDPTSKKSPLMWEDFKWNQRHIFLRRETAKTGRRKNPQPRIIPINAALAAWLTPYRLATGRVCQTQPTQGETLRLGAFIGGEWPHNCLRDSWISYSIALRKGDRKTVAYEAGNSEAMIAQSYEELQPMKLAREYFEKVRPARATNVITLGEKSRQSHAKSGVH